MRLAPALLVALLSRAAWPAEDASLEEWVRARLDAQRPLSAPALKGPAPPGLPGFAAPASLAPLVKAVKRQVVNISARTGEGGRAVGSGIVLSAEGLVVTNHHVVREARDIRVRVVDGEEYEASVVGEDPSTDVAVLRLSGAQGLAAAILGDSDALEVGDWVVAIGSPFGLETSVTHGLLSARERVIGVGPFDDFLQTDAPLNPGNSGGALFDVRGRLVGVTTAVMSRGAGVSFAVPVNLLKALLPNLLQNGRLKRGYLGITLRPESGTRLAVEEVLARGPAARAGVQRGDLITAVDGEPVSRYQELLRRVALQAPGTRVTLTVSRGKERPRQVPVTLEERPPAR